MQHIKATLAASQKRVLSASAYQTFHANMVQQLCAIVLILVLPNVLAKEDYAQIVFVTVLLSFAALSDCGLSLVYGRIVPKLHQKKQHAEVVSWDKKLLGFGMASALVYGLVIASIYGHQYQELSCAAMLLPLPAILFFWSFHISRFSAKTDFTAYRKIISWRALGTLFVLPAVMVFQLTGWFVGMLFSGMLLWGRFYRWVGQTHLQLDFSFVREHLKEALLLGIISVLWLQLLNFARAYASFTYADNAIADYGVMSAVFLSTSTMLISLFLPVSVKLLGCFAKRDSRALIYGRFVFQKTLYPVAALSIIGAFMVPPVLRVIFPAYHLEHYDFSLLFLSLIWQPIFMVLGSIYIGRKQSPLYLGFIIVSLIVAAIAAHLIDNIHPEQGAIWGQFLGLFVFVLLLLLGVYRYTAAPKRALLMPFVKGVFVIFCLACAMIGLIIGIV